MGEQLAEFLVVAPFEIDEGEVEVCGDELCELPEEADLVVDFFLVERFQQFLSLVRQEDCQLLAHIHIVNLVQVSDKFHRLCELYL